MLKKLIHSLAEKFSNFYDAGALHHLPEFLKKALATEGNPLNELIKTLQNIISPTIYATPQNSLKEQTELNKFLAETSNYQWLIEYIQNQCSTTYQKIAALCQNINFKRALLKFPSTHFTLLEAAYFAQNNHDLETMVAVKATSDLWPTALTLQHYNFFQATIADNPAEQANLTKNLAAIPLPLRTLSTLSALTQNLSLTESITRYKRFLASIRQTAKIENLFLFLATEKAQINPAGIFYSEVSVGFQIEGIQKIVAQLVTTRSSSHPSTTDNPILNHSTSDTQRDYKNGGHPARLIADIIALLTPIHRTDYVKGQLLSAFFRVAKACKKNGEDINKTIQALLNLLTNGAPYHKIIAACQDSDYPERVDLEKLQAFITSSASSPTSPPPAPK